MYMYAYDTYDRYVHVYKTVNSPKAFFISDGEEQKTKRQNMFTQLKKV